MNLTRNQKIFAGLSALFISLVVLSLLLVHSHPQNKQAAGDYYDSFSHETVSNPAGKAPDTFGSSPNTPIYLGFDKLLDHGLGFDQLSNLKIAFSRYAQSKNPPLKEISIDVDHITTSYNSVDPNAHYFVYFNVRFDRKNTYKARIEYAGLDDVRLYLIEPSNNKVIFDSRVIGSELN